MEYEAVIGLETHVQLKTKSKMWCGCANEFGAPPNTHVCPVCLGLPGVLPVANEEALRLTALTGLLLNCADPPLRQVRPEELFLSGHAQELPDHPIRQALDRRTAAWSLNSTAAWRACASPAPTWRRTWARAFISTATAAWISTAPACRCMEIVSEPDLTSADMAYEYLNALKDILVYGGVSDCDMEKGMVRCDVNVSVRPEGAAGTRREDRDQKHEQLLAACAARWSTKSRARSRCSSSGGKLIQSTRRWDDAAGVTEEMRTKEHAHDYRYFPDPDLMPFEPTEAWLAEVRARVVELPLARKQRFMRDYQLPAGDAETFVNDVPLGDYFEGIARQSKNPKAVANWVINNLRAKLAES